MKIEMFGILVDALTLHEATEQVTLMAKRREKGLVVTPNVDHIVTLHKDPEFRKIYEKALMITADGMPVVWLSKFLPSTTLPERVTGADLLESVCQAASKQVLSIGFIGGLPGVAKQAAEKLSHRYPGLRIAGVYSPPFGFEHSEEESGKVVGLVREWSPDILFIGVGAPKQEKWADKYLDELQCGPILCTGAAFDFAADLMPRAPRWMQRSGFEWIWRIKYDPIRMMKRYLIRDAIFLYYAVKEILIRRLRASSIGQ